MITGRDIYTDVFIDHPHRPPILDSSLQYRPMFGRGSNSVPSLGDPVLGKQILADNRCLFRY